MLNWVAAHRIENYGSDRDWTFTTSIPNATEPGRRLRYRETHSLREAWFQWRDRMYICNIILAALSVIAATAEPVWIRKLRLCAAIDCILGLTWAAAFAAIKVKERMAVCSTADVPRKCVPTPRMIAEHRKWDVICDHNMQSLFIVSVSAALMWFVTCGVRISYYRKSLKKVE